MTSAPVSDPSEDSPLAGHPRSLARDRGSLSPSQRISARASVAAARMLAVLPPGRLVPVLALLCRKAGPATYEQARTARRAVIAVSTLCAGEGCLPRSLATALLCRLRGTWPVWCTGVRTMPFSAHAWVEADGRPVEEPFGQGYYRPMLRVPPPVTAEPEATSTAPSGHREGPTNP